MQVFIVVENPYNIFSWNIVGVYTSYNEAMLYMTLGRVVKGPFFVNVNSPFCANPPPYTPAGSSFPVGSSFSVGNPQHQLFPQNFNPSAPSYYD